MIIGYARVSTQDQKLERQLDQLMAAGAEKVYQEKITGTKKDRPELQKLLDNLRSGDTVLTTSLTRLSRSTKDLFALVERIQEKGADIRSLKETWLDTTTSTGKLMFTLMAGINQFERDIISERTKDGLRAARARGRKGGRPKTDPDQIKAAITMYESQKHTISEITKATEVSKATLYRYLREQGANKG